MSMPAARPGAMPAQALHGSTLACSTTSRSPSSGGSPVPTVPLMQGTKRKASSMRDTESSQNGPQTCPPIKKEPGTPKPFDFRESNIEDVRSESHKEPSEYLSISNDDETETRMLEIQGHDPTITMGPSEAQLALEAQLETSPRDTAVLFGQEADIHTASIPLNGDKGGTDGMLRLSMVPSNLPLPRQRKTSKRRGNSSRFYREKHGDIAYDSIPDYAPPTSTLPSGSPHVLQVHWPQKAVVDLSNDPHRHMLHEAEMRLATTLNLSCAKYLCTKRRIFRARLQALQEGREFKKSDSQKACKINTNKASKMCNAFERVGWFDRKYFLGYLDDSKITPSNSNDKSSFRQSSSELTELDIWDVSESEFHFTSDGDEESTDEETAVSSVPSNGSHDETRGGTTLSPHVDPLLGRQRYEYSPTGGDTSQASAGNDRTFQTTNVLFEHASVGEGPMTENRRQSREPVLGGTLYPKFPASLLIDKAEESPVLETRSMTQKLKLAQDSRSQDNSANSATVEAKDSQQNSGSEAAYGYATPTVQLAKRNPIPRSLEKANAADIMLVEMKEKRRPWPEIEEAWEKKTGKAKSLKSLSRRYVRIMENTASAQLGKEERLDKDWSLSYPQHETDDDQLLLATEAEIEQNFQREKAAILAEIECNFRSEKWALIAEAMSRAKSALYSAELIHAQYERLNKHSKAAISKDASNHDAFTSRPRQTPQAAGGRKVETAALPRSGVGELDQASNAAISPANKPGREHQTVRKGGPQNKAEHSERMRRVWAKRRALGTNGRDGGPPKANKKAKMEVPTIAPNAGTPSTSAVIHQSNITTDPLSNRKGPIVPQGEVNRDANQHKHSLAQIIPAAAPAHSGPNHIKPFRKHGAKRHKCRSCGMKYVNRSNHYRVYPKIGSEHRRRMAANASAAEGHLRTKLGVEGAFDTSMVSEQNPKLLMSRKEEKLLSKSG